LKILKQNVYCLFSLTILGAVANFFVLIRDSTEFEPNTSIVLLSVLSFAGVLASLTIWAYKRLKMAQLIVENQILHIYPAVIALNDHTEKASESPLEAIEVYVSCFGILLDSKIIKFNQDDIRLRTVKIGRNFISLTYGSAKKVQNARLLHAGIESGELAEIMEKFRYEAGIIPIITEG